MGSTANCLRLTNQGPYDTLTPLQPAISTDQSRASIASTIRPMFALNFYTDLYEEVLRNGRKSATIRLGDKSDKYQTGQLVWVTVGQRYGKRQKLFTAILDSVDVKLVADLSPRDLSKENPEFRSKDEVLQLLRRIYGPEISLEDTVTVVYFSPVSEY